MKLFNYDSYIHVLISILIYVLSLLFPAIYYVEDTQELGYYHSLVLLLFGWIDIAIGYNYSWMANIFYIMGLISFKDERWSSILGLSTLIFSLSLLFQEKIIPPLHWGSVSIAKYGLGYYLWVISFFVFWFGQTWLSICRSKTN